MALAVNAQSLDLAGSWKASLDGKTYTIQLPSTTDLAGLGEPNTLAPELTKPQLSRLTRKHSHIGNVAYSRTFEIPANMANKPLRLKLERVLWKSTVKIDGVDLGQINESLTTPHYFDIAKGLKAGKHTITVDVDNSKQHDISVTELAHAYTNDTQVKWNGILGEMTLSVIPKIDITDLQVYPNLADNSLTVKSTVVNSGKKAKKEITYTLDGKIYREKATLVKGTNHLEFKIKPSTPLKRWDEFSPVTYKLTASVDNDSKSADFGFREISGDGKTLLVNGNPVFLRGTLECCIFPLTGNPPLDEVGWEKVFNAAREWGLNHLRFHSWCPPEAAFKVADKMGFYLQVELPLWQTNIVEDSHDVKNFIENEYQRISREYGNHPSLCLISIGNELQKDFVWLNDFAGRMKKHDPRHLYTTTSFTFEKGHGGKPEPEDDFFITQWTDDGWVRGQGIFGSEPPTFNKNYASAMGCVNRPLISHEIGQYSVYPDMSEIQKYTGTLDPLNFKAIRNDLEKKDLIDRSELYTQASGRFAARLYKEEIERAMKTPGFSGFQLLGLQDFSGQGTALVGLVNAFWESKGLIPEKEFREFCAPVVPLVDFEKAIYSGNEPFNGLVKVANYSGADIKKPMKWTLYDSGKAIASGNFSGVNLKSGDVTNVGNFTASFAGLDSPRQLELLVEIPGTEWKNRWPVWYFPQLPEAQASDVVVTTDLNAAKAALKEGRKVLLNVKPAESAGIVCNFLPVFWSPVHFPKQAAGMGIFCDPDHQALKSFPTDFHSDWQWWHLTNNAKTVVIDSVASKPLKPVVGVVDNFVNNRNLALLFEANCDNGKLMVCSIDLDADRPEIAWLRKSIVDYMDSPEFAPADGILPEALDQLFGNTKENFSPTSIYE